VGAAWGDRAQLIATSPSRLAAQFQAPVLLVHGTNDRSVPYAQTETMVKALQAAGKDVRLVTLDRGDHFLSDQEHRLRFYRELEGFLARHIGTAEPAK
jgi:dipeptidyl aminopeptidase/acylaminoacyl peptidase